MIAPFGHAARWLRGNLVMAVFVMGCGRSEAPPPPQGETPSQEVPTASPQREKAVLRLIGKVAFGEDYFSKVSSPVQGRVVDVRATLGQMVNEGEVLLIIESPDITAAYADYLKEVSELQFASRTHALSKELYDMQALAFKDLKQAENALVKEEAEYNQAKERLVALRVPRSELEKPFAQQSVMGRFELKSPLTGTVVDRTVTPGQWVGNDPAQVLLLVADLDRLQVVAEVHEQDLNKVHVEDVATVVVEAYPQEHFSARITAIDDVVDLETHTVKIRAWLSNPGHKLKPEMYARLKVTGGDEPESTE